MIFFRSHYMILLAENGGYSGGYSGGYPNWGRGGGRGGWGYRGQYTLYF